MHATFHRSVFCSYNTNRPYKIEYTYASLNVDSIMPTVLKEYLESARDAENTSVKTHGNVSHEQSPTFAFTGKAVLKCVISLSQRATTTTWCLGENGTS